MRHQRLHTKEGTRRRRGRPSFPYFVGVKTCDQARSAVSGHGAFASRALLNPLAIGLQRRGKLLADTSTPNPQGGHNGNVGKRKTRAHKEFAIVEFITNSIDGALKPGLDSDRRPIALLIGRRTETDRKQGRHQ
jgi:hypothetical protein